MHLQLNLIDVKPCLCCQIFNALCKLNPDRVQNPEENPREMEHALERISFFSMGEITFFHPFISLQMLLLLLPFTDLHRVGGFVILQPCLNSPHEGIRRGCCQLIASITEDNPYRQLQALKEGLLPILLKMIESDSCSEARFEALGAISSKLLLNQCQLEMILNKHKLNERYDKEVR